MSFFSAAELTDLRAEQTAALDSVCVLRTYGAGTIDAEGGAQAGTATTANVACRLGNPTATEQLTASRLGQQIDAVITLPYGTTVPATAQIDGPDGSTYEVIGTNATQSYQAALRALGKRYA